MSRPTFAGLEKDLVWAVGRMKGWCELKVRGTLGPDVSDTQAIDILNRRVRWTGDGIVVRPDARH